MEGNELTNNLEVFKIGWDNVKIPNYLLASAYQFSNLRKDKGKSLLFLYLPALQDYCNLLKLSS